MIGEKVLRCRICGNTNLQPVVDLGVQCLSGRFPPVGTRDPPEAPLQLVRCTGDGCCGLVQLSVNIPLSEMYGQGYGYLSGVNTTMRSHLQALALNLEQRMHLQPNDRVLDIGSNDGTLLKAYQTEDLIRIGMDTPQYKQYYKDTGIWFIPSFFTRNFLQRFGRPKIITSIAMFYDLPDPNQFVVDIKHVLHPEGIWVLEQSYLPTMIERTAFDTICHEHLEYYDLNQIGWLCNHHGLRIQDVVFNDVNGGSFRVTICHDNYDFQGFNKRIMETKQQLLLFLHKAKAHGKRVHVYGASTKGNVLLQFFGINSDLVEYAADKNPSKWGCMTPGTHIPIISEEQSRKMKPDYYLVLPWHFKTEFLEREKQFLDDGGGFIFPLPRFEVIKK